MRIPQLKDTLSVDTDGNIDWEAYYLGHDPNLYFPGKKVTSEEFNKLITQSAAQTNYLTTTLKDLFTDKMDSVVSRKVTGLFDLKQSFFKAISLEDWGTKADDGYYYITISPQEHGYEAPVDETVGPNIDTELYLLDPKGTGQFYEVSQIYTLAHNVVTLYTDVPCLGYVTIRSNMRAVEYKADKVDAANVVGLHPVAITGDYNALANRPDYETPIQAVQQELSYILDGNTVVKTASNAYKATRATILEDDKNTNTDARIGRYKLTDLFETIGPVAKQASRAHTLNYYKTFETTIQAKNVVLPDVSVPSTVFLKPNTWYAVSVSRKDISSAHPSRAYLGNFFIHTRNEFSEGILHTFPYFYSAEHVTQYALQIKPQGMDYTSAFDVTLFRVTGNVFEDVREEYYAAEEWCTWDITINEIPLVLMEE